MSDWPGKDYYDYYESVTAVCRWPGCRWEGATYWDENMHQPFVEHFLAVHAPDAEKTPSPRRHPENPSWHELGAMKGVGPLPHPRKAAVRRLRVARPLEEGSGTGPLNTETQPRDAWGRSEVTSSPWIA